MYCRICGRPVDYGSLTQAQQKGDSFCYCPYCDKQQEENEGDNETEE